MPRATSSTDKSARAAKKSTSAARAGADAAKKTAAKKAPATKTTAKKAAAPAKKAAPAAKKTTATKAAPAAKKAPAKAAPAATKTTAAKKSAPATKATAKKTPTRTPVKPAAPRKPVKLDAFQTKRRADLLAERATYVHQADTLQAEADLLAAEREPGDVQFDEESGEGDTMAVTRDFDLALSAQARAAVEEIDAALARLEDGTYGTCVRCGKKIKPARLEAIPHAALCIDCKAGGLGRL